MTPDEYCQDKTARSGSSFYYSFLFLPAERRRAITALYAFCREVDDVVDEISDKQLARTKLHWWHEEVERLYEGKPQHPVTLALQPHVQTFELGRAQLLDIIAGMRMDLDQNRYLDFEGLKLYCHRVAGVVGMLAANIFGCEESAGTSIYAARLGLAFQLTNIIRDVGEDARKGRIYLPLADLQQHGVTAADIFAAKDSPRFQSLMREQAARARDVYRSAFASLPERDRRAQRPGLIMAAIYKTLLDEIEADGFRVLTHRTSLTPVRKLWLASKAWVSGQPPRV